MSPASYLAAPPRVAATIVARTTTIVHVDWAVYGALVVAALASAAGAVLLTIRVLQAWRAFKRLRRHLARALETLADAAASTSENAARLTDQPRLEESAARLRTTLRRFAVLRAAIEEVADAVRRVTAVYPRA